MEIVTIRGIVAIAFLLAAASTTTFPNIVFSQTETNGDVAEDEDTFSHKPMKDKLDKIFKHRLQLN